MNIEDLKDSELITELYERMTAPKESNIDRMIRESFERIDNIIELACDDLDDLKKKYQKQVYTFTDEVGLSHESALYDLAAMQNSRSIQAQGMASGRGSIYTGLGGLGMASATGFFR